jgi:hypothetical protein
MILKIGGIFKFQHPSSIILPQFRRPRAGEKVKAKSRPGGGEERPGPWPRGWVSTAAATLLAEPWTVDIDTPYRTCMFWSIDLSLAYCGKYTSFEKEFNIKIGYRFGLWTRKGSISGIPIDTWWPHLDATGLRRPDAVTSVTYALTYDYMSRLLL